jgi:hypothetical protein
MIRLALVMLGAGLLLANPALGEVVLVRDGRNLCLIYLYAGPSNPEKAAAAQGVNVG